MGADLVCLRCSSAADLLDLDVGESIHDFMIPSTRAKSRERLVPRLSSEGCCDGVSEHAGLPVPPALRRPLLASAVLGERPEVWVSDFVAHVAR
jgi:hypothetical protein